MADRTRFSTVWKPYWMFLGFWCVARGMIRPPLPKGGTAFKIGLVGPWNCDPFFSKAFPQVAATLAVQRVKKDPSLSTARELDWTLLEEDCQTCRALAGFTGYEKLGSAFVGPLNPGYCDTASLLGKTWDKAIFSWTCVNYELARSNCHPSLVGTLPSSAHVLAAVLKHFNWAHIGIVSSQEDFWVDTANKLASTLRDQGLPVRLVTTIGDGGSRAEGTWARIQAAQDIKVIILCMPSALVGGEDQATLLIRAQEMGLADGRYIFVPYDTLLYSLPYRNHSYFLIDKDRTFREAYDAVLTITLESGDQTFYEAFGAAKKRGEITTDLEPQQVGNLLAMQLSSDPWRSPGPTRRFQLKQGRGKEPESQEQESASTVEGTKEVTPLFGTIYDAIYLAAKALEKAHRPGTSELSGTTLAEHVRNLNFAGFSHRIQVDSRGRVLANYVILDTDGKGSSLTPTYLLVASSGLVQSLGRAIHFPGGGPPPADSSCWFDPDVLCIRGTDPPILVMVFLPPFFLLLLGICLVYLIRGDGYICVAWRCDQNCIESIPEEALVSTWMGDHRGRPQKQVADYNINCFGIFFKNIATETNIYYFFVSMSRRIQANAVE